MKSKLRLWRGGGTLILAAGLTLGSAPVVSAAGAEVDLDVVTKVVTAYQDLLDSHWTDSNCSLSSCVNASSSVFASSGDKKSQRGSSFGGSSKKGRDERKDSGENPKFTKAEATILRVRDAMKDFGMPIKTAKSTINVEDAKLDASGKATVSVAVGTTKTYEHNDKPSYMVNVHTVTLAPSSENLFAVIEDIVDPIPQEEDPGDVQLPEGVTFDPVPIDRILGTESSGGNRPAANTSGAEFSLLPAHKDSDVVSTHQVQNIPGQQPHKKRQGKPDVRKMVEYATFWTDEAQNPDKYKDVINPAYPKYEYNCANFVSQTLEAGGWKRQGVFGEKDPYAWNPYIKSVMGGVTATRTWSYAPSLYAYAKMDSPYHTMQAGTMAAQPGDLLFVDFHSTKVIGHAMVVTGRGLRENKATGKIIDTPLISQKTINYQNHPLFESIKTTEENGNPIWYALTTR